LRAESFTALRRASREAPFEDFRRLTLTARLFKAHTRRAKRPISL